MKTLVERLKLVPTQRDICHEAATEIELMRAMLAVARRLIVERGESTDWPLQIRQHLFLAELNELGIGVTAVSADEPLWQCNCFARNYIEDTECARCGAARATSTVTADAKP